MDGVVDESIKQIICSFPRFLLVGGMFSCTVAPKHPCRCRCRCHFVVSLARPIAEDKIMHCSLSASHSANCRIRLVNVCYEC